METSVLYVQDAYKNVRIPKAMEVLNTQVWDYERKLQQIKIRKQQYERLKLKEIVPSAVAQNENSANIKTSETANAQSISRSIDKTIKDFNDKYGSTSLMVNMNVPQAQQKEESPTPQVTMEPTCSSKEQETKESPECMNKKCQNMLEEQLQVYEELPSLAPLELPSFDFSVFMSSGLVENFQK